MTKIRNAIIITAILMLSWPSRLYTSDAVAPTTFPFCPSGMVWVEAAGVCVDRYEFPNRPGREPLRGIRAEEAKKLCEDQGKRLPIAIELMEACGGKEIRAYPYGKSYRAGNCRDGLAWPDGPAKTGSHTKCITPEGVLDLTGNVWEWAYVNPGRGSTVAVGGAWNSPSDKATCGSFMLVSPAASSPNVGFRCVFRPAF